MIGRRNSSIAVFFVLCFAFLGICSLIPKGEPNLTDVVGSARLLISAANSGDIETIRQLSGAPYDWKRELAIEAAINRTHWPLSVDDNWTVEESVGRGMLVFPSEHSPSPGILLSESSRGDYKWLPGPGAIWYGEQIEGGKFIESIERLSWSSVFQAEQDKSFAAASSEISPTAYGLSNGDAFIGFALRGFDSDTILDTTKITVESSDQVFHAQVVYSNIPILPDGKLHLFNSPVGQIGVAEIGVVFSPKALESSQDLILKIQVDLVDHSISGVVQAKLDKTKFTGIQFEYR